MNARISIALSALFLSVCALAAGNARAQEEEPSPAPPSIVAPPDTEDLAPDPSAPQPPGNAAPEVEAGETLDTLFADLKRESDADAAGSIIRDIWAEWNDSGSATVDALMGWAGDAMTDSRYFTALDLLDQVIVLEPDYAEGWNRRATLHYMLGDHGKSMADINRVLKLEPRHFGALSGMGMILMQAGNDEMALRAFQRVLKVFPADANAQQRVMELQEKLAGDPV